MLSKQIPLRGALTYGEMYVDENENVFFGPALVEAVHYAESQDWINYVITEQAEKFMDSQRIPTNERLNLIKWKIPWKADIPDSLPEMLYAGRLNHYSHLRNSLDRMLIQSEGDDAITEGEQKKQIRKYKETLKLFAESPLRSDEC